MAERSQYIESKRGACALLSARWKLSDVREAIQAIVRQNTKLLEYLLESGGDSQILEENFEEIHASTENFITVLCNVSGWSPEEVGVTARTLVEHSKELAAKEETVGAPSSEPSSEPTWVYEPYVGGTEGAERTEPVGVRAKIRALVLSNDPPVAFERSYGRKLPEVGVEVVRVLAPDRRVDADLSGIDVVMACKDRMSHSQWYASQEYAKKAGVRMVTIGRHSSNWAAALRGLVPESASASESASL